MVACTSRPVGWHSYACSSTVCSVLGSSGTIMHNCAELTACTRLLAILSSSGSRCCSTLLAYLHAGPTTSSIVHGSAADHFHTPCICKHGAITSPLVMKLDTYQRSS